MHQLGGRALSLSPSGFGSLAKVTKSVSARSMTFAYQSVSDDSKRLLASKAVMVTGANSGCGWEA